MGHMMAAQIEARMAKDIQNIPELIQVGQFGSIRDWLQDNIHSKGRLMRGEQLIEDVTGQKLSADPLLHHIEERYLKAA